MAIDLRAMRDFVRRLTRVLRLGRREFNVCFVDDAAMHRLNGKFRGQRRTTDVLSFPSDDNSDDWHPAEEDYALPSLRRALGISPRPHRRPRFLGEVAISAPAARRNARVEGHTTANEMRWLILHGVLHLLGYDHETDSGEMKGLELALRETLGI